MIGAALSTALSATVGVVALSIAGVQPWSRFGVLWREWWFGDAVGALIVGPVILTMVAPRAWSRQRWIDAGLLVGGGAITTHLVFGEAIGLAAHPLE